MLVSARAWRDYLILFGGRALATIKWVLYVLCDLCVALSAPMLTAAGTAVFWTMSCVLALELCLIGSRVLRTGLREQTLTGLPGPPPPRPPIVLMTPAGARSARCPTHTRRGVGARPGGSQSSVTGPPAQAQTVSGPSRRTSPIGPQKLIAFASLRDGMMAR